MPDGAGPAARIGVGHRHRVVIVCGHGDLHPGLRRGHAGAEPGRAGHDPGPPAQAAQHDPLAADAERAHRRPRRSRRADPDPGEDQFQPRLRGGTEPRGVQPHPRIGVLRSPVVADGPPPPGHGHLAAVDLERPGDVAIRDRGLELGARQRRLVQHLRTQRPQRRLLAGDGQVPARALVSQRGLPLESLRPGHRIRREVREDLLDHDRRLIAVTIHDGAPQGNRLATLAGAMPGVAYPQRPGRGRVASAHEPRLVPARTHLLIMPSCSISSATRAGHRLSHPGRASPAACSATLGS